MAVSHKNKSFKKSSKSGFKKSRVNKKRFNKTKKIRKMRGGDKGPVAKGPIANRDDWNLSSSNNEDDWDKKSIGELEQVVPVAPVSSKSAALEKEPSKEEIDEENGYFVISKYTQNLKVRPQKTRQQVAKIAAAKRRENTIKQTITSKTEEIDIRDNIDSYLDNIQTTDQKFNTFKSTHLTNCPSTLDIDVIIGKIKSKKDLKFLETSNEFKFINNLQINLKNRPRNDIIIIINEKKICLHAELLKYILYILLTGMAEFPDIALAQFLMHDSKTKLDYEEQKSGKQIGLALKYITKEYPEMKAYNEKFNWNCSSIK